MLKKGIPERCREVLMQACGVSTIFIGAGGVMSKMLTFTDGTLETQGTMLLIFSMIIGSLMGSLLDIEQRLEELGEFLKRKFHTENDSLFVEGFVTSTLVICIGAMAIVGSIEDSLNHDYTILFTKAVMDGVLSIVFAASLGIGAAFSMFPIGIYQGSITLLAGLVKPYLTDLMIGRLSCIGSILIFALGLNLTIGTKIKIANLLPAVFLPVIVCLLGF